MSKPVLIQVVNPITNMVTIAQGPIGKDVKASELDVSD